MNMGTALHKLQHYKQVIEMDEASGRCSSNDLPTPSVKVMSRRRAAPYVELSAT